MSTYIADWLIERALYRSQDADYLWIVVNQRVPNAGRPSGIVKLIWKEGSTAVLTVQCNDAKSSLTGIPYLAGFCSSAFRRVSAARASVTYGCSSGSALRHTRTTIA